ncbi:hypothetical protein [uncultured Litoreibacter sp.]|uniref:hypothetical protein n=1 Tax=uncultured Litoreibacter sp. TaxID=1392394 RepID=UPI0026217FFE|nr:hypothetical protein [uncultured Litoreibacter sp.]
MTGPDKDLSDAALDAMFDEARTHDPAPSPDLLARIAADAATVQREVEAPAVEPPRTFFGQVLEVLGGWPTVGGLATATVAGLYIGMAQPGLVGLEAELADGTDFVTSALLPGDDLFFEEG